MLYSSSPLVALLAYSHIALAQTITVNVNSLLQIIDGFGVSQAFGRASQFQNLSSTPRTQGLDYLFSTTTGAGLSIIRNRIGSGGTGDSIEPNSPGSPSSAPTYVWDDNDSGQVWFSQAAMTYGVKTIYADAWSAPGFMKTNGNEADGGYLCGETGHTCSSGDWRQAYANLLVQYVKYYASAGIPITHLGFLNEPDFVASYSSMQSTGSDASTFIPTLYNTLQSSGLSNVTITCCDATGWSAQQTMTSQLVSAGMEAYLGVITSHAYSSDPTSPMATKLKTWQTENADLNSAFTTTWYSSGAVGEGMTWANKISTGILSGNLSAYLYWEGVEVNEQQADSYLVMSDGTNVTPSGRLWAFAGFSRYVRPGAHRVATSGSISNVAISAYVNTDGSVVIVFINNNSAAESATLSFSSGFIPSTASAWLTDNSHSMASYSVTLSNGAIAVSVPSRGMVTVKATGGGSATSPPTTATTSTTSQSTSTTSTTTSTAPQATQTKYGQCGGIGWAGPTVCATGSTCTYSNAYYSQCL